MNPIRYMILVIGLAALGACGSPEERAAQHLAKSEQLLEEGDIVKAKLEAQNAAQILPKDPNARVLLAKIAEQDQEFRAAVGHLLVAVDADPNHVEARIKLGNYYFLGRAVEQAREQAQEALKLEPDNAAAHLLNGRVKFLEGDKDGAMTETDRALELDPGLPDAIMFKAGLLAERQGFDAAFEVIDTGIANASLEGSEPLRQFRLQLLRRAGQDEALEEDLQALARDFPDKVEYQYALSRFYASRNRTDEAEQVIRNVIADKPEEIEPKLALIRILAASRGAEAAEEDLQAFIASDPENLQLRQALGSLYESLDRRDEAYDAYSELAQLAPRSDEGLAARNRMVIIDIGREELDTARGLIEEILVDAPDNADALLVRAAFRYADREFNDAISDLRVVLRKEESSERALRLLARSYVQNGDAVLAQDTYRRLLAIKPGDQLASAELATLLARQGEIGAAEDVLRERLEAEPDDSRAMAGLVQTLLAQQDIEAAELEARRLVDLNEENALAQFQLGRVMQAKGDVDEAVAAYKMTLEENPNATPALQGLTQVLVQNGREQEALDYLQSYLQKNPGQPAAQLLLGAVHARTGNVDAAREVYEAVISGNPQLAQGYAARSGLEPAGSDARLQVLRRGYDANPTNASLALLLTTELERQEQYEEAMAIYESLVEANPDNLIAANNLAALMLDHRDDAASHARALELAKKLEQAEQAPLLDTVGWAYYRNGDYARAVRYLERAVAGASELAILRYHLGMAYAKNNNPVGARQELSQALELAADSTFVGIEEARATLAEIEAS
ncbi:MAG: tetratricopeptide repeat protein [Gammaproteobacteria bacterium]|nr:tetratricopeptide repeat protein [Gammaproteobacteria bacterium]